MIFCIVEEKIRKKYVTLTQTKIFFSIKRNITLFSLSQNLHIIFKLTHLKNFLTYNMLLINVFPILMSSMPAATMPGKIRSLNMMLQNYNTKFEQIYSKFKIKWQIQMQHKQKKIIIQINQNFNEIIFYVIVKQQTSLCARLLFQLF